LTFFLLLLVDLVIVLRWVVEDLDIVVTVRTIALEIGMVRAGRVERRV